MLDVGSGRGVFLIPFMKEFPWVKVTSLDLLEKRVTFLNELADGGFGQLHAEQKDIEAFIKASMHYKDSGDRARADSILQVSASANKALYREI